MHAILSIKIRLDRNNHVQLLKWPSLSLLEEKKLCIVFFESWKSIPSSLRAYMDMGVHHKGIVAGEAGVSKCEGSGCYKEYYSVDHVPHEPCN